MTDFDRLAHDDQLPVLLDLATTATRHWDLPIGLTVQLINLSENATYAVTAPSGQKWALRIHRDGYHSKETITSELAWLTDLRAKSVVITPRPLPGRNGQIIQIIPHHRMARPRHIVMSEWEAGNEPGIGQALTRPFEVLGEATARMHRHARSWQRPPGFTRPVWNFDTALGEHNPHWGRWRDGIGVDGQTAVLFGRAVGAIGKRLHAYGDGPDRFGLIHCDLRLANLLVQGDSVKVIDFDDCGFGWFMYDAATPVSFYEHEPHVPELIEAWKAGYRREADLSKTCEAEIPTFIMLRRLLLVAWIGSHAETDLAKSMGLPYTKGTIDLCETYLRNFG